MNELNVIGQPLDTFPSNIKAFLLNFSARENKLKS